MRRQVDSRSPRARLAHTPRFQASFAIAALAIAALAAGGCSSTQTDLSVSEGTPVTLGNLQYNVQVSRFLNPSDPEDRAYLQGAPALPRDDYYLSVFVSIDNEGYEKSSLPTRYDVTDTAHNTYTPVAIDNEFALPLSGDVPARRQLPDPGSIAANGPIGGMMLLFLIHESSTENRPLTLKIPAAGNAAPGRIQLDI
jgi:hypothetical protein